MSGHMPGFGDPATWPPIGNHGDPRNEDEPKSELERSQDLLDEVRGCLDVAETAVFRRDWQSFRIAMLDAHNLSGSLWS